LSSFLSTSLILLIESFLSFYFYPFSSFFSFYFVVTSSIGEDLNKDDPLNSYFFSSFSPFSTFSSFSNFSNFSDYLNKLVGAVVFTSLKFTFSPVIGLLEKEN
jgi:hypothetical protein